ncbi:putative Chaperone protein DnaJ 2 [Cardiosporidium cionae]|uniref:Chaperone protein DnaJ 2 n=1 Tax=Cardiosporidium cionae TaxID=476202 RepID=A0ABQ7JC05_9APIC|nr:putative Chaperone protein DnaJ 2 [Cardiosporidium cionae]|eukprot:KAF8821542.1 putative Chaperone protein DnaJ 2 [Cardiosporidium cionae]
MATHFGDSYDYYDILNVTRENSLEDIKASYRELSLLYHPDKQAAASENHVNGDSSAFIKIQNAYEVLSNDRLRYFYDKYGPEGLYLLNDVDNRTMQQTSTENPREENVNTVSSLTPMKEDWMTIEKRVQNLARNYKELGDMKLLNTAGVFTLAYSLPFLQPHKYSHLKSKWANIQFSSCMQQFGFTLNPFNFLSFTYLSHLQGNFVGGASLFQSWEVSTTRQINDSNSLTHSLHKQKNVLEGSLQWISKLTENQFGKLKLYFSQSIGTECQWKYKSIPHSLKCKFSLKDAEISIQGKMKIIWEKRKAFSFSPSVGIPFIAMTNMEWTWKPSIIKQLTKLKYRIEWSLFSLSLHMGIRRAGFSFDFPLELYSSEDIFIWSSPSIFYLLLISAMPPFLFHFMHKLYSWIYTAFHSSMIHGYFLQPLKVMTVRWELDKIFRIFKPSSSSQENSNLSVEKELQNRTLTVSSEIFVLEKQEIVYETYGYSVVSLYSVMMGGKTMADLKRNSEMSHDGLVIVEARFGDPSALDKEELDTTCVIDVSIPLMAKVRNSQLAMSSMSKKNLIGFYDPCAHKEVEPELLIRYKYAHYKSNETYAGRYA